jgi:hypothetical protein
MQVQAWQKTMQKELILNSVWEQLSNRVEVSQPVPNSKGMDKVPDSVVISVSDDFNPGTRQTTIPFLAKLNAQGQGGRQKVDGNEEIPGLKFKPVRYNIQRKGVALEEESVDGDLNRFYRIGSMGRQLLTDYFTELSDYNYHRALLQGADEYLTQAAYWDGASVSTPPATIKTLPNVYFRGGTAKIVYDVTEATYTAAIQTALNALTSAGNPFSLTALDAMIFIASQTLIPLKWSTKGNPVNYVFLLTEFQARELMDTTVSNSWSSLMRDADVRGDMNRQIQGVIGVYRGALCIVNPRAPLWDTTTALPTDDRIGYIKPWSSGAHQNQAGTATPRTAKTGAGTGTIELALALGRGALGSAKIKETRFDEEKKDYNFYKGLAAMRAEGCERMDFNIQTPTTLSILNQTSFAYGTASPSTVF